MSKRRKSFLRCVAFAMSFALMCSGILDDVYFMSSKITGNVSGKVEAEAATSGTVNADTFSWDNASVYFLLTDRFRNGNESNDHSYNRGLDKNGNVANIEDDRGTFHGGDFAGITQTIKDGYFNDLGVNAIWISAPYEQIHGYIIGSDDKPSFAHYSYHGYYVLDYTDTDANFGTEAEFKELVDTAHEHGIRVVIDIVLNHAGYNSLYDMDEYGFGVVKDGWEDTYYNFNNANNGDYHSNIDYESNTEMWGKWWGPGWVRAGLPGYTQGGSDSYTMSLTGLPDFKTESTATVGIPAFLEKKWKDEGRYDKEVSELKSYLSSHGYSMTVTNCISYWLSSWVREYGVDGFRCDTAKHVELASWARLNEMCTEALKTWKANNPTKKLDDLDFWMTGECWDHTLSYDGYYTQGKFDSMINFDTTGAGVLAKDRVAGKYEGYAAELNTKDDYNVLSYISSHDSTLARGDQIYIGSAFLMLPGGIQIYYGDETNRPLVEGVDFDGYGGAGHSLRSDMNWDDMDEEVLAHWQKVGRFRNNHISVGAGSHTTVTSTSGVAFTRTYDKNGIKDRVAACIGASANSDVTIDVSGVWSDGESVVNYYDGSSAKVSGGNVTFNSGANGTILIGDPDGKPLVTVTGDAKFKGTQQVTISVKDAPSAIVSIDGAKKFIAKDGDKFTIGATAYEGDTVSVSYSATNEKGTNNGKATFYKAYNDEDIIGGGGGGGDEINNTITIRVKPYGTQVPYLYVWDGDGVTYNGGFPGKPLTEKDENGNYIFVVEKVSSVNCIVSGGSNQNQSGNITGINGEALITVESSDYKQYKVEKVPKVESKYAKMKQEARSVKNMTSSDYTSASWKKLYSYIASADALVAQGEANADIQQVETMYNNLVAAKSALVLATPSVTSAVTGSKTIKGKAAYGANVTVTLNGKKYTTIADEVTGVWTVTSSVAVKSSDIVYVTAARDGLTSGQLKYEVSGGQVETVGWKKEGSYWYYYNSDGSKATGWKTISGKSYYFNTAGVMQTSKWISGKYYVKADGVMAKNEIVDNGKYYVNSNGEWVKTTGWKTISGKWYYLSSGEIQKSKWISGKYYVKADGVMAKSEVVDKGRYYVDANGEWVKTTGWQKAGTKWYYLVSGEVQKSKWISGKYYVKADGTMATSEIVDNGNYYVNADGEWTKTTGWQKVGTKWYYLVSGKVQKSKWISGKYYVKADGTMATSEWVDGGKYYVGADGVWIKNP